MIEQVIKDLADEQRELRSQRKTVYFTGKRKITAYEATEQHRQNRFKLRHLYIALAIIRNKEYELPKYKEFYQTITDKYVKEYAPVVQRIEQ